MNGPRASRRARQRGLGTLSTTLLLMLLAGMALLYLDRGLVFGQRAAANQVRAATALEAAEAGIEWATGMLNQPWDIRGDCAFDTTTNISFRRRYVQTQFTGGNTGVVPATNVAPGCQLNADGTLVCSCPAVPAAGTSATAALPATLAPGFTLAFAAVNDPATGAVDPESVRVTATGCSAVSGACTPASAAGADALATVSVILKLRPLLRAAPASSLTCGSSCSIGGSFSISNTDPGTNGITVNAGTGVAQNNGTTVTTIAGIPPQNSIVAADASLAALSSSDTTCSNSSMFKAYFGATIAEYAAAPATKSISCSNDADCGVQVWNAYNDGWRAFYFPDGFALNNSAPFTALGSSADPVTLVSPGSIDLNGNIALYGLLFSNNASTNALGTGTSDIRGALVSCAAFDSNGSGQLIYDATALRNVQRSTALMVRVPGSWRDF